MALEDAGVAGNTFVFITSDNGAYSWVGSNFPFRGQKGDLFEGGHRVPAIAYWPGKIPGGSITDVTAMTIDIAPTFLSIAGLQLPDPYYFDGADLSKVLFENKLLEERMLFWRFHNPYDQSRSYAVRQGEWKYLVTNGDRFLFHLQLDPTETNNLIDIFPEKADMFEQQFRDWSNNVTINR
jgi:arylsulfatase A-like enzyme